MTKQAPTLADALLAKYAGNKMRWMDPNHWITGNIARARKFVLDESMSAFSADLAYGFLPRLTRPNRPRVTKLLESQREHARLPHACMWIEQDLKARTKRAATIHAAMDIDYNPLTSEKSPQTSGWLLMQHPRIDTAFMAIEGISHTRPSDYRPGTHMPDTDPLIYNPSMAPLGYVWSVTEAMPPWPMIGQKEGYHYCASALLTGIYHYQIPQVGWVYAPWVHDAILRQLDREYLLDMQKQLASDLRYLWALLNAINDTPVGYRAVTPMKGHMVGKNYKRFSEHTVITLNIPAKMDTLKLAKKIAMAARRRAHQVRGHYRRNWRDPVGEKIWITEHQRGDASLGFVLHDYKVEHPQ